VWTFPARPGAFELEYLPQYALNGRELAQQSASLRFELGIVAETISFELM
jgi:hypothetical protein